MMRYMLNKNGLKVAFVVLLFVGGYLLKHQDRVLAILFPEKIWVHRVNSIKKLQDVQSGPYRGIELDLIFEKGKLMVNHGESDEVLCLYDYLKHLKDLDLHLWLDMKNLQVENSAVISAHLDSICLHFGLDKAHIIVESQEVKSLRVFREKQYLTSYYLPGGLYQKNENERRGLINQMKASLVTYPTDYVSFDRHDYGLVKPFFPDQKCLTWGFYTWGFYSEEPLSIKGLLRSVPDVVRKIKMLSDEEVQVLLVSYNSEGGNT